MKFRLLILRCFAKLGCLIKKLFFHHEGPGTQIYSLLTNPTPENAKRLKDISECLCNSAVRRHRQKHPDLLSIDSRATLLFRSFFVKTDNILIENLMATIRHLNEFGANMTHVKAFGGTSAKFVLNRLRGRKKAYLQNKPPTTE